MATWEAESKWASFLSEDPATRSSTSICLHAPNEVDAAVTKRATALLEAKGIAFDIGAYRAAPPGFRIWGGATVDTDDVRAVLPWLDWAMTQSVAQA